MELFGFELEALVYWHWFIIAVVFFVLEVLTLSFFFLWLGSAAISVGVILLLAPVGWPIQLALWAGFSVIGAIAWRIHKKNNPGGSKSDEPLLNQRGEQYVGRTFTLQDPIENGFGKVKVDDSIWKVECGEDLGAGKKVKVTAVAGTVLQVEEEG